MNDVFFVSDLKNNDRRPRSRTSRLRRDRLRSVDQQQRRFGQRQQRRAKRLIGRSNRRHQRFLCLDSREWFQRFSPQTRAASCHHGLRLRTSVRRFGFDSNKWTETFHDSILVQHESIPQAILGTDIVCQAKSGMGKTAVFVLATLQQLEPVDGQVSVIVLCHTRELAFQISREYERFRKYMQTVKVSVFFGGLPTKNDEDILKKNCPHVVVGTPGRILALAKSKALNLRHVKHFIIDECDKVLESLGKKTKSRVIFPKESLFVCCFCRHAS